MGEYAKRIAALNDALSIDLPPAVVEDTRKQLLELAQLQSAEGNQYELLLMQQMTNYTLIETMCLMIDSTTIRDEVRTKGGKVGYTRWSQAMIMDSIAGDVSKMYKRMRKIHDALAPGIVAPEDTDEDTEEEFTGSENDVVTREDREKIKESMNGVSK